MATGSSGGWNCRDNRWLPGLGISIPPKHTSYNVWDEVQLSSSSTHKDINMHNGASEDRSLLSLETFSMVLQKEVRENFISGDMIAEGLTHISEGTESVPFELLLIDLIHP